MEAYYYQHLNKVQQAAYHAMKTGFTDISPRFSVPRLESQELADIFFQLRLDCPEIFYVTSFSYRFARGADNIDLLPEYLFDKGKIRDHQKALSSRIAKLARPAQTMTVWEKERYIHDFICTNVRYDKLKKPYSHEIIGPLGQGVGVCEGIAKAVKALCDALGVWCVIAVSEASPSQGVKYRHAWNILKIEGQYYHLDATFDSSLSRSGMIRYDYFNLDDSRLFQDHQPLLYPAPACCTGNRFYYRENKLSFSKVEEAAKRAQICIRKGLPFVFHWRGGPLTPAVLAQITEALDAKAQQRGRYAALAYNPSQAVLQVHFPVERPERQAQAEAADEERSAAL